MQELGDGVAEKTTQEVQAEVQVKLKVKSRVPFLF